MNRLFVLFVSVFAAAFFFLDTPPDINAGGRPFEEIKDQLYQVNEAIQAVPEMVYAGLRSGANHWVSPFWRASESSLDCQNSSIRTLRITFVNILNGSRFESTSVKVNIYEEDGDLRETFEVVLSPRRVWRLELNPFGDNGHSGGRGWIEVVADRDVFVDGSIDTYIFRELCDDSEAKRTMTWYPVDSE